MSESSGEAPATSAAPAAAADAVADTEATALDPAPPEEFVQAAKLAPDHWLYLTDPAWRGEGPPPEWAVVGQWRSDSEGEIVDWEDNEDYRPSPEAMGWPEPADDVDRAIQLATTGYGPAEDVTAALAKAEVAVLVTADGAPVSASAPDGTAVVPVYTSPRYLQLAGRLGFETLPVADVLGRVPEGHSLCVNSSAPVSMVLNTDGLAEVLEALRTEGETQPGEGEQPDAEAEAEADAAESPDAPAPETESPEAEAPEEEAAEPEEATYAPPRAVNTQTGTAPDAPEGTDADAPEEPGEPERPAGTAESTGAAEAGGAR